MRTWAATWTEHVQPLMKYQSPPTNSLQKRKWARLQTILTSRHGVTLSLHASRLLPPKAGRYSPLWAFLRLKICEQNKWLYLFLFVIKLGMAHYSVIDNWDKGFCSFFNWISFFFFFFLFHRLACRKLLYIQDTKYTRYMYFIRYMYRKYFFSLWLSFSFLFDG